jgi:ABC-type phosphate transport system substrate-binding protein
MLKAVASKPGAIGYVRLSEVNNSVKVVAKISGGKLQ